MRPRHHLTSSPPPAPQPSIINKRMGDEEMAIPGGEDGKLRSQFDRSKWQSVICAVAAHCCIGGIYTFSLFVEPLARNRGVVGLDAADWNVSAIIPIFSMTITMAGLTAAFTGAWAERVGPNRPIMYAGVFWGGGLMACALGLRMHSLWLVYFGYGFLGGFGVGLACAFAVS
jgi:hypothetical protein